MFASKADLTAPGEAACAKPVQAVKIDLDELARPQDKAADRRRLAASLLACLIAHAALLYWMERRPETAKSVEEAIPVEIIVEPPAPEAAIEEKSEERAQEQPAPEPPAQTLEEPPATDFARAADQDEKDGKDAEAPAAAEPEQAKERERQAEQTSPPEAADEVEPPPTPAAEPIVPPPAKTPRFTAMVPLPDLVFQTPARRSEFPSGAAQPGYLSTLYGRIMRHMRAPQQPAPARNVRGRVVFGIMSSGQIFNEAIAIPSGVAKLDAAALAAVRKAAPYPPPPQGGPIYIRFDYGSN